MARTEKLQNIIDEEASAHVFYYDYPPKADPELSGDTKGGATSETDKAKKLFEDQINTLKRNYEREYNDMITTFSAEHEEMQALLSSVTRECVEIKDKYVELDVKFKEYYMRSDHYIKQQAADLQQVKTELQQLQHRNRNYESLFKAETERGDKFEKVFKELQAPFQKQKEEMHKLKLEVIKYEQKYSFIDIDKLQEEIASWKTLYEEQLERSTVLQIDLFEIRERIMDLTQKFDKGLKKKDVGLQQWKAGEDAENLCTLLTNHMTNPNYFGRQPPEEQMQDGILDDGITKAHIDL